jgi:hypothetical protein
MEQLTFILDCIDWLFVAVIVLSGRIITNWFGDDTVVPKSWIVLVFATLMAFIFLLARHADGSLFTTTWTCYLHSYVIAAVFYQHIGKQLLDFFEQFFKKLKP